jgi:two-component sensor histidine kinase
MKRLRPTAGMTCFIGCAVGQLGLLSWWLVSGATLPFVVVEILLAIVFAALILVVRYFGFRHRYEEAIARNAALIERNRLAEQMHDVLGHELSVIALRAGSLQVRSTGATQQAAADIRRDVERTVDTLRYTLDLLRDDPDDTAHESAAESVVAMIDRVRGTGAVITLVGAPPEHLSDAVECTVYRIAREALTNAIKHAPAQPITVTFEADHDELILTVENPIGTAKTNRAHVTSGSSGVEALRRHALLVGGRLTIREDEATFTLSARLPLPGPASPVANLSSAPRTRRPLRATLLSAVIPSMVAIVGVVGFYTWSVHDATLEGHAFQGLRVGMPSPAAHALLPSREAPVRLVPSPPREPSWACAYYSDGNFPLGFAVFQVCFDSGAVVSTVDLRREPWL